MRRFNFESKYKCLKIFVLGFLLGAVAVSLMLDNRLNAVVRAFQNPTVVNSLKISVDVVKK